MSRLKQKGRMKMRVTANKRLRAWLALVVASAGLALIGSPASAASPTIDLCATAGSLNPLPTTAPSFSIPIWGFSQATAELGDGTPDCSTAPPATLPGPVLVVNEGDTVTLKVANALPSAIAPLTHAISIEIPGVAFTPSSDADADVGQSASVTFSAAAPGTYVYRSAGDAGRQEAMGLYGALLVRPTSAPDTPIVGQAYHPVSSAYDVEATLVLSQVDPAFNADPDGFNMLDYLATYWLINGTAYPDTASISASAGQNVLLRYVNAGYDNTSMSLLGMHQRVLARDAYLLNNPFSADAETIPAGATEDAITTVPSFSPPSSNGFPLFNRNLHVTNGSTDTGDYATPGGMLTFIAP